VRQGLKHVGSTARGIGAGAIDFDCGGCGEKRCLSLLSRRRAAAGQRFPSTPSLPSAQWSQWTKLVWAIRRLPPVHKGAFYRALLVTAR